MLFYHEHRLVVVGSLVLFVGILQVTEQELRLALFLHQTAKTIVIVSVNFRTEKGQNR